MPGALGPAQVKRPQPKPSSARASAKQPRPAWPRIQAGGTQAQRSPQDLNLGPVSPQTPQPPSGTASPTSRCQSPQPCIPARSHKPPRKVCRACSPIAFSPRPAESGGRAPGLGSRAPRLARQPPSEPAQECQALASPTPSMTQREDQDGRQQRAQPTARVTPPGP